MKAYFLYGAEDLALEVGVVGGELWACKSTLTLHAGYPVPDHSVFFLVGPLSSRDDSTVFKLVNFFFSTVRRTAEPLLTGLIETSITKELKSD